MSEETLEEKWGFLKCLYCGRIALNCVCDSQIIVPIKKAAILDELIDQAATVCAIICNSDEWISVTEACASIGASSVCETLVNRARFGRGIDLGFEMERCERWAEAEARLRNGECWDLLIGGDQ